MNRQLATCSRAPLDRPSAFYLEPVDEPKQGSKLSLTVVFTNIPATLAALRQAGELAYEQGARIRILVAQIVPYPLPIDRPAVDPKFNARHFRTVWGNGMIDTQIDVRLCRDRSVAIAQALHPQSIVLIGGRKRWWPTHAQRLAMKLSLAGHHVIFVPQG